MKPKRSFLAIYKDVLELLASHRPFEVKNPNVVTEFLQWFNKYSKDDVNLTFVKDSSAEFGRYGVEYVDDEEQEEIEKALTNPECHEISHSKTVSF